MAISSSLSCIFSGALICFSFVPHFFFFVLVYLLRSKGLSLRCSPGQGNPHCCIVMLYVKEGPRGNNATCLALCQLSVTSPTTHKQIGPFWCWFPGGWVCVCSRTLWVSPTNSPMRLGVSPAASTSTGFFGQRF